MNNKLCIGLLMAVVGAFLVNRLGHRWGATDEEVHASLPGDEIIPHPMLETTHAITIHAAAAEIWPWLVQMGYDRGGWYTDASWWDFWIDPALRAFMTEEERARAPMRTAPSADRVLPQFQHLEVGDLIHDGPPGTAYFTVKALEPNRFLALYSTTHVRYGVPAALRNNPKLDIYGHFTWVFVLQESREHATRLILRTRANVGPRLFRVLTLQLLLPAGEIFTARRMLRGIKKRVEHAKGKRQQDQVVTAL
jgi:hypothetical protein